MAQIYRKTDSRRKYQLKKLWKAPKFGKRIETKPHFNNSNPVFRFISHTDPVQLHQPQNKWNYQVIDFALSLISIIMPFSSFVAFRLVRFDSQIGCRIQPTEQILHNATYIIMPCRCSSYKYETPRSSIAVLCNAMQYSANGARECKRRKRVDDCGLWPYHSRPITHYDYIIRYTYVIRLDLFILWSICNACTYFCQFPIWMWWQFGYINACLSNAYPLSISCGFSFVVFCISLCTIWYIYIDINY